MTGRLPLVLPALVSALFCFGYAAQAQELWNGLTVGMTHTEVLAHDPNAAEYSAIDEPFYIRTLHSTGISILGYPFEATYSFKLDQLELVTLEPEGDGLTSEMAWGLVDRTVRHFSETYGPPAKQDSFEDRTLTKRHRAFWALETGVDIEVRAFSEPPFSFTVRIEHDPDRQARNPGRRMKNPRFLADREGPS